MGSPLWMCLRRYASDQRRPCLLKIGMRLVKRQQDGPQPRIIPQMLGDRERPEGPLYNLMRCHSVLVQIVRDVPVSKRTRCHLTLASVCPCVAFCKWIILRSPQKEGGVGAQFMGELTELFLAGGVILDNGPNRLWNYASVSMMPSPPHTPLSN